MDRQFYRLKAFREAVTVAKTLKKPLEIWLGDEKLVTLKDLPSLIGSGPGRYFQVRSDHELQQSIKIGCKYSIVTHQPSERGEYIIGEWA